MHVSRRTITPRAFSVVSVFGAMFVTACGGGTAVSNTDSGTSQGGSGSGSGGGSGSSGSGSSGSGSSSGGSNEGGVSVGACPGTCKGSCCLTLVNGQLQGTCAASAAACTGAFLECAAADECMTGLSCCVSIASGGMPSSTSCLASCPGGSPFACGHGGATDNKDCPGGAVGWTCDPIPGTPSTIFNQCTAAAIPDGGPAETGAAETGASDTGTSTDGPSGG